MFSNSMGRQKVEAVPGGVPLQGHHGPYGSEIAEYHRKSFRQDSTVRVGAATVRFRNLEQNILADALSRQPLQGTSRRVSVEDDEQSREQQGRRNFRTIWRRTARTDKLFRHIPQRVGNKDVASWKVCLPIGQRQRVMTENNDVPIA